MCVHCSSCIVHDCSLMTIHHESFLPIAHDCPDLAITNGMVNYQPQGTPPVVGTIAFYTCNNGYTLNGDRVRTCQDVSNWTWTGSDPSCNRECNLTFEAVTHILCMCPYLINGYVSGGETDGN